MCSVPQMLGWRGRQDMGNVVMRAYWHSKQLFVAMFIFHFREKYLDEQTSTRLYFQSKDALRWWGLFSCVCFSCWSAVSFCCEEQWLMGRYYHSYKKTTTVLWCLPWGPYSSCTMVFTQYYHAICWEKHRIIKTNVKRTCYFTYNPLWKNKYTYAYF